MSRTSPDTPPTLRERAMECERQAAAATLPEVRKTLLHVASRWRELADEDEEVMVLRLKGRAAFDARF
jgi:hypothetical protein